MAALRPFLALARLIEIVAVGRLTVGVTALPLVGPLVTVATTAAMEVTAAPVAADVASVWLFHPC